MNSDCCNAPMHGDPSHVTGICSKCGYESTIELPMPEEPPSRNGTGILIGVAMSLAMVAGGNWFIGPHWLSVLTGITAVACVTLAARQKV